MILSLKLTEGVVKLQKPTYKRASSVDFPEFTRIIAEMQNSMLKRFVDLAPLMNTATIRKEILDSCSSCWQTKECWPKFHVFSIYLIKLSNRISRYNIGLCYNQKQVFYFFENAAYQHPCTMDRVNVTRPILPWLNKFLKPKF